MKYKFEQIDITSLNPEEMVCAVPVLFTLLAKMVTQDDAQKLDQLYRLIDSALECNKETSCHDQIALVGKVAKFSLSGE